MDAAENARFDHAIQGTYFQHLVYTIAHGLINYIDTKQNVI